MDILHHPIVLLIGPCSGVGAVVAVTLAVVEVAGRVHHKHVMAGLGLSVFKRTSQDVPPKRAVHPQGGWG